MGPKPGSLTLLERLERKTIQRPSGCWEWVGQRSHGGYGRILIGGRAGRKYTVHRVAYEELIGPIPTGLVIDHRCFNPPCWNPEHLEAVTPEINREREQQRLEANSDR